MVLLLLSPLNFFPASTLWTKQLKITSSIAKKKYPNAEFIPADCDNYDEDEWVTEDSFEERNIFEVLDDEILHQNNVKYNLCLIVVVLYIWLKNA